MAVIDPVGLVCAWALGRYLGTRSSNFGFALLSWLGALIAGFIATVIFRMFLTQGDAAAVALTAFASLVFIAIAAALGVWLPWPGRVKKPEA